MLKKIREQLKKIYSIKVSEKDYIDNFAISKRWILYILTSLSIFIVSAVFCFTLSTISLWDYSFLCSGIISIGILIWFGYIEVRAIKNGKHLSKEEIQHLIERFPRFCDINYVYEKYNLGELT